MDSEAAISFAVNIDGRLSAIWLMVVEQKEGLEQIVVKGLEGHARQVDQSWR
jgi:hypothetical protein